MFCPLKIPLHSFTTNHIVRFPFGATTRRGFGSLFGDDASLIGPSIIKDLILMRTLMTLFPSLFCDLFHACITVSCNAFQ